MDPKGFQKACDKLVAKAWSDDEFKAKLLADPMTVFRENDLIVPEGVEVRMAENTDNLIDLIFPPEPSNEMSLDHPRAPAENAAPALEAFVAPRRLAILGSTGSIGTSTLDVCRNLGEGVADVVELAAGSNWQSLAEQALSCKPQLVALADSTHEADLRDALAGSGIDVVAGPDASRVAVAESGCDTLYIGLESINPRTLKAYKKVQTVEGMEKALEAIQSRGIDVHGMFVFGADTDDAESSRKTVNELLALYDGTSGSIKST